MDNTAPLRTSLSPQEILSPAFLTRWIRIFKSKYPDADIAEIEESVSHTILMLLLRHERGESIRNIDAFMHQFVRRKLIDLWRCQRRHCHIGRDFELDECAPQNASPLDQALRNEERERLMRHIDALPPKLRTAISLRYLQEVSTQKAIKIMRISRASYFRQVKLAKETLRAILRPKEDD